MPRFAEASGPEKRQRKHLLPPQKVFSFLFHGFAWRLGLFRTIDVQYLADDIGGRQPRHHVG